MLAWELWRHLHFLKGTVGVTNSSSDYHVGHSTGKMATTHPQGHESAIRSPSGTPLSVDSFFLLGGNLFKTYKRNIGMECTVYTGEVKKGCTFSVWMEWTFFFFFFFFGKMGM